MEKQKRPHYKDLQQQGLMPDYFGTVAPDKADSALVAAYRQLSRDNPAGFKALMRFDRKAAQDELTWRSHTRPLFADDDAHVENPLPRLYDLTKAMHLTDGELAVLRLRLQGYRKGEIAGLLKLSRYLVRKHLTSAQAKAKAIGIAPRQLAPATRKQASTASTETPHHRGEKQPPPVAICGPTDPDTSEILVGCDKRDKAGVR